MRRGGWSRPRGAGTGAAWAALGGVLALAACGGSPRASEDRTAAGARRSSGAGADEPEDGVEVQSSRGVLEPEQIRQVVEPHSNELSGCYLSRVGDRRWLGGRVQLKWELDGTGAVRDVHIAESDLGSWPVERCLLGISRRLKFPAPRGGSDTDFTVPLEFSATGSAAPWSEERSAEALGPQLTRLDECAAMPAAAPTAPTAPAGDPAAASAPREVLITLYLGAQGQVLSSGFAVDEAEGFSEKWADCAHRVVQAWRTTEPKVPVAKLSVRYRAPVAAAP